MRILCGNYTSLLEIKKFAKIEQKAVLQSGWNGLKNCATIVLSLLEFLAIQLLMDNYASPVMPSNLE